MVAEALSPSAVLWLCHLHDIFSKHQFTYSNKTVLHLISTHSWDSWWTLHQHKPGFGRPLGKNLIALLQSHGQPQLPLVPTELPCTNQIPHHFALDLLNSNFKTCKELKDPQTPAHNPTAKCFQQPSTEVKALSMNPAGPQGPHLRVQYWHVPQDTFYGTSPP